ncbi:lipopolysaccharide assembly protein LapA domain-containing protein [Orbaceae bacterium ac157xtp]
MKFVILFLLFIVIFAISLTFGANNGQVVNFNFLIAQTEFTLSTLLAIMFGVGLVIGWFSFGLLYFRTKFKLRSANRKLRKLQKRFDEQVANHKVETLTSTLTQSKAE